MERQFTYYENGKEEIFSLTELEQQFNGYTVEERQHELFTDWLAENLKMQILIER
jgi:hypothetical protein